MEYKIINSKKHLLDWNAILLYIVIFFSGDTYLFGTNSNDTVLTIARYLLIVFCLFILFRMNFKLKITKNRSKVIAFIVMVIAFSLIAIANGDSINRTGLVSLYMTVAFFLCVLMPFDEFARTFTKVIYFISITAVIFTLIAYIAPGLVRTLPIVINTAGTKIYTCGFAGLLDGFIDGPFVRTQGIFWEPGAFQMYVNLAIAIELLYKESSDHKHIVAYTISLILSFSTTGYIVFILIMVSYLLLKKSKHNKDIVKKFAIVAALFICSVIFLQFTAVGDIVFGKIFDRTNVNFGSMTTRLAGIIVSSKIALSHPVHGIGVNSMSEEFLSIAISLRDILGGWTHDNTNTLFFQFAAHGIPYGILFAVGTYKFGNCFAKGKIAFTLSIFIMMLLMYVGENLQYSIFPYIVIFYGYGWKEELSAENNFFRCDVGLNNENYSN